jgi:hypothetical protein
VDAQTTVLKPIVSHQVDQNNGRLLCFSLTCFVMRPFYQDAKESDAADKAAGASRWIARNCRNGPIARGAAARSLQPTFSVH